MTAKFTEAYARLNRLIQESEGDADKFKEGNKAAGTRVRKAMQEIKSAAQDVRKAVLEK